MHSTARTFNVLGFAFLLVTGLFPTSLPAAESDTSSSAVRAKAPLKALLLVGGGYHDYAKLAPHLSTNLSALINASFVIKHDFQALKDPHFADAYDVVVYDWCFDEAPDDILEHALGSVAAGKPAVMIHCAVHAFRRSPKISEWETCCGMRSKVHDRYEGFTVVKLDATNPITLSFPEHWDTAGDELYQTIAFPAESHALLRAKSPQDGREHIVGWTHTYQKGQVFSTTLGHDMKTAATPEYLRLVASGMLWTCGKLGTNGVPLAGYAGPQWNWSPKKP